ncbi:chitobiase/beta-hexosaminidase C-terminal domain-containing protein [Pleomorphochaeta sp. DL1XJH-081]|uniref:chitobiase/beta-hexosaminidase C-terminal domain-containing protein n=1 Tax=Pleomorphochaeta sp. DL1XJH-081 TaxID=3409690 RepID=UPI003BB4F784
MRSSRYTTIVISIAVAIVLLVLGGCDLFSTMEPDAISFSRDGGTYFLPLEVAIQSRGASAIYFTTDGSMPNRSSARYYSPITLDKTTRLKAIALDSDGDVARQASVDFIIPKDTSAYPYLDVASGMIYHVSSAYEYSLDDGSTWQPCTDPVQKVTISVGDSVWVRHRVVASDLHFLGTVDALEGYDLRAGQAYIGMLEGTPSFDSGGNIIGVEFKFIEKSAVSFDNYLFDDFKSTIMIPTITNVGDEDFHGQVQIVCYASDDPIITADDDTFLSVTITIDPIDPLLKGSTLGFGEGGVYDRELHGLMPYFINPDSGLPNLTYESGVDLIGKKYIGFSITVVENDDEGLELLQRNNWTLPQHVDAIHFSDSTIATRSGALKLVNSWGTGEWENIDDGHYWISFEDAIKLKLPIYYMLNNFSQPYRPTLLARFRIEHPNRQNLPVWIGVGDPEHPIAEKLLQTVSYYESDDSDPWSLYTGGEYPFPDNAIVLDISEFAPFIAANDLFMRIDNSASDAEAILHEFSIELHPEYLLGKPSDPSNVLKSDDPLSKTIEVGKNDIYTISTAGKLSTYQLEFVQPNSRGTSYTEPIFQSVPFTDGEVSEILDLYGRKPTTRSARSSHMATGGLLPPTEADLRSFGTLRSEDANYTGILPEIVDLSRTIYFPPIGNQGQKGSCNAFSGVYYIHTYNEAREHGWDLSGAAWESKTYGEEGYPGYPSKTYWDRIMSPDFVYHQSSAGRTAGSRFESIPSLLSRIGSSTWASMPYDNFPDEANPGIYEYPWPSEQAFREAAMYRSRVPTPSFFSNTQVGMFFLDSMAKVELLQQLLASGYCVTTGVDGFVVDNNRDSWLDENDVMYLSDDDDSMISDFNNYINHAQTIVGYKSGAAWDPDNP